MNAQTVQPVLAVLEAAGIEIGESMRSSIASRDVPE
jgi:hypothetical protein